MPGKARIRYSTVGIPEMIEWDIKGLTRKEFLSFMKKIGTFNPELIPRVDWEIKEDSGRDKLFRGR